MQNTVYERKRNSEDFILLHFVTNICFGNRMANVLVTEQPQYSVVICAFSIWQNTETMLISNVLRFIFTCPLSLALPITFHQSRHTGIPAHDNMFGSIRTEYRRRKGKRHDRTNECVASIEIHVHTVQTHPVLDNRIHSADDRHSRLVHRVRHISCGKFCGDIRLRSSLHTGVHRPRVTAFKRSRHYAASHVHSHVLHNDIPVAKRTFHPYQQHAPVGAVHNLPEPGDVFHRSDAYGIPQGQFVLRRTPPVCSDMRFCRAGKRPCGAHIPKICRVNDRCVF